MRAFPILPAREKSECRAYGHVYMFQMTADGVPTLVPDCHRQSPLHLPHRSRFPSESSRSRFILDPQDVFSGQMLRKRSELDRYPHKQCHTHLLIAEIPGSRIRSINQSQWGNRILLFGQLQGPRSGHRTQLFEDGVLWKSA